VPSRPRDGRTVAAVGDESVRESAQTIEDCIRSTSLGEVNVCRVGVLAVDSEEPCLSSVKQEAVTS